MKFISRLIRFILFSSLIMAFSAVGAFAQQMGMSSGMAAKPSVQGGQNAAPAKIMSGMGSRSTAGSMSGATGTSSMSGKLGPDGLSGLGGQLGVSGLGVMSGMGGQSGMSSSGGMAEQKNQPGMSSMTGKSSMQAGQDGSSAMAGASGPAGRPATAMSSDAGMVRGRGISRKGGMVGPSAQLGPFGRPSQGGMGLMR